MNDTIKLLMELGESVTPVRYRSLLNTLDEVEPSPYCTEYGGLTLGFIGGWIDFHIDDEEYTMFTVRYKNFIRALYEFDPDDPETFDEEIFTDDDNILIVSLMRLTDKGIRNELYFVNQFYSSINPNEDIYDLSDFIVVVNKE